MPDADGKFKGIALTDVPWKQEFAVDDAVRCIHTGDEGIVYEVEGSRILVGTFGEDRFWTATPGELRPL